MKKLSICIIVKNEEANLKRCLDSFLPIIHERWCELVIVDTGSKDRTLQIAKQYTKKVFEKRFRPWNFSKARNYGIERAVGKKIMIIDADEELRQESLYILEDVILNPRNKYPTVFIKLLNFYTKDRHQFSETVQARIFDQNTIHYEGCVHNRPMVAEPYLFATTVVFNHYGYMFEGKEKLFKRKKNRSLPMLEREYKKDPDDLHILTHLIKTYWLIHDVDKVIELGEIWVRKMRKVNYHDGWFAFLEVFVSLIGSYLMKNDIKNALRTAKESYRYSDKLMSIDVIIGNYYTNKNPRKALKYFEKVLLKGRANGSDLYEHLLTSNMRIIIPEILNYMAIEYFGTGEYRKAGNCVNDGILLNQNRLPLRWDVFNDVEGRKRLIHNG